MKIQTIASIFNYAAVPLYLFGEGLQRLAAGIKSCSSWEGGLNQSCQEFFRLIGEEGINIYNMMPMGGQAMQYYFSGFFGAAALNYIANAHFPLLRRLLPEEFRPSFLNKDQPELCAAFSMAALTYWEMTHRNFGQFDWKDMGVYVFAVGLSYGLNKLAAREGVTGIKDKPIEKAPEYPSGVP